MPSSPQSSATNTAPHEEVVGGDQTAVVDGAQRRESQTSGTTAQDWSKWNKRKTPWSRTSTEFARIVAHQYDGKGTEEAPFLVTWLPGGAAVDPENPMTFTELHKWTLAVFVSVATLAVALASSAYSGATASIAQELGGSRTVITLGVSLFVLGFALGPLVWAPLSELMGRRNLFLFTYFFLTLWNAVAAASPNLAALLVFRFLAGAFGSSPLANAGGTLADVFAAKERGLAMAVFALAPFMGPALGPITGGFLGESAGFRWVQGFLGIFAGVILLIGVFLYTETYSPLLLRQRATKLSEATGHVYISQLDAGKRHIKFHQEFLTSLGRPWLLLVYEPIVLLLSLYTSIVYAILYSFFSAFPIVFQEVRGWSPGIGGLSFLGILVGMLIAIGLVIVYINPKYIKSVDAHGGVMAPPEERLLGAMIGAPLLVLGLALFAATDFPSIHWSAPIILSSPFGFAMVLIFLSLQNYLIDAYLIYAASVLAANSVIRSLLGAAFPLFTPYMYNPGGPNGHCPVASCGIHVGPAIGGAIALLFIPAPFYFFKQGAQIRKRCKYAAEADKLLQRMLASGRKDGKQEEDDTASSHSSSGGGAAVSGDLEKQQQQPPKQPAAEAQQHEEEEVVPDHITPDEELARSRRRRQQRGQVYNDGDSLSLQYSHHSVY